MRAMEVTGEMLAAKFEVIFPHLDERQRRLLMGAEARALGHGGIRAVAAAAGIAVTLHALRHTAAYRMAEDPALPLTDVQFVLGHALLSTTQIYLTPRKEEVIRRVLAHHAEQARQAAQRAQAAPAPGYRPETMDVLFGGRTS